MPRALALCLLLALVACEVAIGDLPRDASLPVTEDAGASGPLDGALAADAASPGRDAAAPGPDAASPAGPDAGAPAGPDAGPGCGAYASATQFTCTSDGSERVRCAGGALTSQTCARGCLRVSGAEDVCLGASDPWSCAGSWGTEKAQDGDYYLTAFGCWTDASGAAHSDPYDNCIPGCLTKARQAGVCTANEQGPACERRVNWYVADAGRFGCLARLRITNPANQKSVVAVVLDYGPSCSIERSVSKAVLDASSRVDVELFGSEQGASDRALVHVVEVDDATPLGPVP